MNTRTILFELGICSASCALAQDPVQVIESSDFESTKDLPAPEWDETEPRVYTIVEQMPEFPGGSQMMFKYMGKNIKYPADEQSAKVQGTVYVTFVVNEDGRLSDTKVLRGVAGGPGLGAEALRAVNAMPSWTPGVQNGKLVKVQYNLPIRFLLD